jgi:hypothetical protein
VTPCAHPACGVLFEPKRPGHRYHAPKCRAAASRARHAAQSGIPGRIRSVRRLKDGTEQVILHIPPLWAPEAHVRKRGDTVRLVMP